MTPIPLLANGSNCEMQMNQLTGYLNNIYIYDELREGNITPILHRLDNEMNQLTGYLNNIYMMNFGKEISPQYYIDWTMKSIKNCLLQLKLMAAHIKLQLHMTISNL
jgi:hypothetical protein